jgi:O-methyltransferase
MRILQFLKEPEYLRIAALMASELDGDFAEVGVFEGGTADIICKAKGDRHFHLFDTGSGLPESARRSGGGLFEKGHTSFPLVKVKDNLRKYNNLHFYEGLFPDTSLPVKDKRFTFVHLDCDLYDGTKAGLEFFYPRMVKGGIIIVHDYSPGASWQNFPKVEGAVNEFFADKPEAILKPPESSQAVIVKAGYASL